VVVLGELILNGFSNRVGHWDEVVTPWILNTFWMIVWEFDEEDVILLFQRFDLSFEKRGKIRPTVNEHNHWTILISGECMRDFRFGAVF